ncbi:hypothetical protein N0V88_005928 [Collariella sp. IMI 366227]|nr:hypothetical protein N0V88_005928 [Collariella sp. IMI 366227]
MAPAPSTPRRTARGRPRGRPKGPESESASRDKRTAPDLTATEPPPKRRRYIPGGPGGGGRFVDEDGTEIPTESHGPSTTVSRPRASAANKAQPSPSLYPRRERSTRIRTAVNRDERDDMQYSSAAAVAAAVVQSEGYKPREERGWEEFHPNLDIDASFIMHQADHVDGVIKSVPPTPVVQTSGTPENGAVSPTKETNPGLGNEVNGTPSGQGKPSCGEPLDTPSRRRLNRPARESFSLYATRTLLDFGAALKVPKVLPIQGQTSKERLDLKLPQYRKTNRIALFESKTFGQARYVDKSMMNVGYQESDNFIRPDRNLIKATDANMEEEIEQVGAARADGDAVQHPAGAVGRVEYDMDEQDDMWLEKLNTQRKAADLDPIAREIFEITITKIEKEWHALEKRIPKPNPKPPQTHRPRSSSAAAVNGEPQAGEEQDSKCAICDDGDCENTNAIVFCDGCDLAVHQECYGVPFIPEGQWLCRKCQLIGRGIPTCIFCPNTDGAFKQTNSSKWAHLLCAMWIPEVSLGNHTFMEPVMEVEKVPKTRWRLTCYICSQRMGACIQCSNKNCYQAFHVTCARRCRLFLKMKNSQGALAVLDGTLPLKAFCDKHCPPDYAEEHSVAQATKDAKRFYKRTMKGRIWADSQASALQLAATHRNAVTEHPPDESQITGAKVSAVLGDKKKGQPPKNVWKLPSGAPIIPQAVYDLVESALARFPIRKRKDFVGEACKYWTLKREARRGAALLKRLQLQMEAFSSMELTRRDFATMGPSGKARLQRRVRFCRTLIEDLEMLKELSNKVVQREALKLEAAELEMDFVDSCYFPVFKELQPILDKAFFLDKNVFKESFQELQDRLDKRFYATTLHFAHDLCQAINVGINNASNAQEPRFEPVDVSPSKHSNFSETGARRRLGKRILKLLQPYLETALRVEADICRKPLDGLQKELEGMIEASLEVRQPLAPSITVSHEDGIAPHQNQDIDMADAPVEGQIIVADHSADDADADADADADGDLDAEGELDDEVMTDNIEVGGGGSYNGSFSSAAHSISGDHHNHLTLKDTSHLFLPNGFHKPQPSSTSPLPPWRELPNNAHPNSSSSNNSGAGPAAGNGNSSFGLLPAAYNTNTTKNQPASTQPATVAAEASENVLTDGGVLWYLNGEDENEDEEEEEEDEEEDETEEEKAEVEPDVVEEGPGNDEDKEGEEDAEADAEGEGNADGEPASSREPIPRGLSEELTDMDDEVLRDLGVDVLVDGDGTDKEDGGTITIPHTNDDDNNAVDGEEATDAGGDINGAEKLVPVAVKKAVAAAPVQTPQGGEEVPRKRTRAEVAAQAAAAKAAQAARFSLRKGVRSSARRKATE